MTDCTAFMRRICAIVVVVATIAASMVGCASGDDVAACEPTVTEQRSVPRLWIEANLNAIRRDFPAPTVHARNLWHLSAVLWDVHAAYTPNTKSYFAAQVDRSPDATTSDEAASIATNFAAYRLLTHRYEDATGASESVAEFDALLAAQCLEPQATPEPGSPAAVGIAIADAAIEFGRTDGALEAAGYLDLTYSAVNPPLVVASDTIEMHDPNRWQPLELAERVTQNGQTEDAGAQQFIGANWGLVTSFALPEPDERGITLDPGPPPLIGAETHGEFVDAVVQIIGYSDLLGGESGAELIDISPASLGNNALGEDDGRGRPLNPATGAAYATNQVPHGDYGRAIAEFWADGPDSETPPGHWNTLAIAVVDQMAPEDLRWGGQGPVLSRDEWDLRMFFTLNASLHDTAVAVWGAKRAYDYARPISMVRYLGAGNDGGLPVVPGLVEIVTEQGAAVGGAFQGLPVGETVVRSWLGPVRNPSVQTAGVGWRSASAWIPYQRPTFVSPAFAAYASGHSGFSRAAADVMTLLTGSEFFPGGMLTHMVEAGTLIHEDGPSVDVELQWATYQDAADEAGESRRYGGIHVEADDLAGRTMGATIAELVWAQAQTYFG